MLNHKLKIDPTEYSYARFISSVLKLCKKKRLEYKLIGYEKFEKIKENYPLYRITVHPEAKYQFCLVAGVQAYEIAGPLAMLPLLETPHKYLRKDVCYHIYPMINPTSFDLRQRFDDDGCDLNLLDKRALRSPRFKEVQNFYKDIKGKKFDVFVSLHEDEDRKDFYAYVFGKEKELVYWKVIKNASKYCGIWKSKKIYGTKSDEQGLIINEHDHSFEDILYGKKMAKISLCTETPGKLDINTRIKINLSNIKILSDSVC